MEIIKLDNLKIVSLQLKNVYDLKEWQYYEDPLFSDYNFPELDDYEVRQWFESRVEQSMSKSFAVLDKRDITIGLINIKNIKNILRIADLGIVFDSKFVNQGYGTKSLKAILNHYFETMNMRTLYLEVAEHNKRAIRSYEKCGFETVKTYTIKTNDLKIEDIDPSKNLGDFLIKDDIVHIYCRKMKISKSKYQAMSLK